MADVAMPRLSDSMEEGTILKWLKSDGDEISRGDELVEIETDKANMTYEADQDGALKIVAQEGDTLPVGDTIAQIGGSSDGAPRNRLAPIPGRIRDEEPPTRSRGRARRREAEEEQRPSGRPRLRRPAPRRAATAATAAAPRRRRWRAGWRASSGSSSPRSRAPGPAGGSSRPTSRPAAKGDGAQAAVEAPAAPEPEAPEAEPERKAPPPVVSGEAQTGKGETTTQDLSRLQQTVARRMAESKATAPDFLLNIDVDMEEAVDLRKRLKAAAAEGQPVPSFNDFVVKAAALALRRFPARERRVPRRQVRALLARQRRRRGRRPGRARGPDRVRRRQQVARPDRA